MRTSALLKLHQRQIDLLDMIVKCDNYINNAKPELKRCKASKDYYIGVYYRHELITRYEAKIAKYTAIKFRLIRWYLDIDNRKLMLQAELAEQLRPTEAEANLIVQESLS